MEQAWSVAKKNLIFGLMAVFPVGILAFLFTQLMDALKALAAWAGLESALGAFAAALLALVVGLGFCFVLGALVRTRLGSRAMSRLEEKALVHVPGYQIVNRMLKGFAESETAYSAALVRPFGAGAAMMGYVMEENGDDTVTVFVPFSPMLTLGNVYIMERSKVTPLPGGGLEAGNCLTQWGIGSGKALAFRKDTDEFRQ